MKSIMHSKEEGTCYLCMRLHNDYMRRSILHEHHVVFGWMGAGRKLSEKYGLKVYLCPEHHLFSDEAVHKNEAIRQQLCEFAQIAFEREFPNLVFKDIFGMNYIEKKPSALSKNEGLSGFTFLDSSLLDEEESF